MKEKRFIEISGVTVAYKSSILFSGIDKGTVDYIQGLIKSGLTSGALPGGWWIVSINKI